MPSSSAKSEIYLGIGIGSLKGPTRTHANSCNRRLSSLVHPSLPQHAPVPHLKQQGEDILASFAALPNFAVHRTNLQPLLRSDPSSTANQRP
jgi:hypothetical protein